MQRDSLIGMSLSDIQSILSDTNCVIVSPQMRHRNLILSYILQLETYRLAYFRLDDSCTTLPEFSQRLLATLATELNTEATSIASDATPEQLAKHITQSLKDANQPILLVLDEVDRLPIDEAYHSFFTALVNNLSSQTKLVINARTITTEPWRALVKDNEVSVIGNEHRVTNLIFTPDDANRPQLEIYAFGRGHAIVNGLPVVSWDGALPRNLFFYFIDNDLVTRDQIFKAFWPDLQQKEATNVFHVTKRKVSERLSFNVYDKGNYDLTSYSTGFYRPSEQIARHYDVEEFEQAVEQASMTFDDTQQMALYQRAVDLYRAPFLLTIDMPWVHERRERLQRLLLEALIGIARIQKSANNYDASLGYFIRALYEKPLREDLHREVMQLYRELGYPDDAIKQYQHLETILQDTLNVAPSPETQTLLAEIQN